MDRLTSQVIVHQHPRLTFLVGLHHMQINIYVCVHASDSQKPLYFKGMVFMLQGGALHASVNPLTFSLCALSAPYFNAICISGL